MTDHRKEQLSRTALLLGDDAVERLSQARVAVFGVGGVGGFAAEALARSGIGALDLIDGDVVSLSNLNRQIIALHSTVGKAKTEIMAQRIQDIEEMCLPGSEDMTNEAKFTKPMSAEDYAKAVVKNAKKQGDKFLAGMAKDADDGGVNGVEASAGAAGGGEKKDEFMDALKAMGAKK